MYDKLNITKIYSTYEFLNYPEMVSTLKKALTRSTAEVIIPTNFLKRACIPKNIFSRYLFKIAKIIQRIWIDLQITLSRSYSEQFNHAIHLIVEAVNLKKTQEINRLVRDQLAKSNRDREEKIAKQRETILQLSLELNDIENKIHVKKAAKARFEEELELKGRELRDLFVEISEGRSHPQEELDEVRSALKSLSEPISALNEELAALEKDFSEKQEILADSQSQINALQAVGHRPDVEGHA